MWLGHCGAMGQMGFLGFGVGLGLGWVGVWVGGETWAGKRCPRVWQIKILNRKRNGGNGIFGFVLGGPWVLGGGLFKGFGLWAGLGGWGGCGAVPVKVGGTFNLVSWPPGRAGIPGKKGFWLRLVLGLVPGIKL